MGSYATLKIGPVQLDWKYFVPPSVAILFEEDDFVCDWPQNDEDGAPELIGFATSRAVAADRLERLGYGDSTLLDLYGEFYPRLQAAAAATLRMASGLLRDTPTAGSIERQIAHRLAPGRPADGVADLAGFRQWLAAHSWVPAGSQPHRSVWDHLEAIALATLGCEWEVPPAVLRWANFFEEENYREHPEIVEVCLFALLAGSGEPTAAVVLDLADILASSFEGGPKAAWREEALRVLAELPVALADKVHRYVRFFNALSILEPQARLRYSKLQLLESLSQLTKVQAAHDKGLFLENLVHHLITSEPGLTVASHRYHTGDEEIDLVVKNNVDRPFWVALGSPFILIECKNWTRPVGAKDFRDFAGKLENHRPLVRLGLFIAANGFTAEFEGAMKRAARSEFMVVRSTIADLEQFAAGNASLAEWLEELVARSL